MNAHGKASFSQTQLLYPISHTTSAAFPSAQGSFWPEMRTENISSIWKKSIWCSALQTAFGLYLQEENPLKVCIPNNVTLGVQILPRVLPLMPYDYIFTIAKECQVSNWNNTAKWRRKNHLISLIHTIFPKTQLLTKVRQKKQSTYYTQDTSKRKLKGTKPI